MNRGKKKIYKIDIFNILLVLYITIIILTNIITPKYFSFFKLTLTSGILTYPFTFLITDIVSELFNENKSKLIVWLGFVANILMIFMIFIVKKLPIANNSPIDIRSFNIVFDLTPGIVLSSMIAYLFSQFLDIYLFTKIKKFTNGKYLWLRNNVSTIISQFFDTFIFSAICLGVWFFINKKILTIYFVKSWVLLSINELIIKIVLSFFYTPILYFSIFFFKKITKY